MKRKRNNAKRYQRRHQQRVEPTGPATVNIQLPVPDGFQAQIAGKIREISAALQATTEALKAPGPKMALEDILAQSPDVPGYGGGKWAFYSVHCCWWTSFPEDLGSLPPMRFDSKTGHVVDDPGGNGLPCCPHCGSVLMQAPLEKFIESAQQNPAHYGPGGLETFVKTHSRNSKYCAQRWDDYYPKSNSLAGHRFA